MTTPQRSRRRAIDLAAGVTIRKRNGRPSSAAPLPAVMLQFGPRPTSSLFPYLPPSRA